MDESRLNDIEIARSYYEYTTTEYSINDIVSKCKIGQISRLPYPQNPVWDDEMESKYIESILLGMPIIPIVALWSCLPHRLS